MSTTNVPPSVQTIIRGILRDLLSSSPYIKAAALIRVSGLSVVSLMPRDVEEERVSAMTAAMLLLGERITSAMKSGQLDKVYIKGADDHIILMAVGDEIVLTLTAREEAHLGLLFVEMRFAAQRLKKLFYASAGD